MKTHHAPDYSKDKDADVIKKGSGKAVPDEHWVKDVGNSVFPRHNGNDPKTAFLACRAKDRPQPHEKINECDH